MPGFLGGLMVGAALNSGGSGTTRTSSSTERVMLPAPTWPILVEFDIVDVKLNDKGHYIKGRAFVVGKESINIMLVESLAEYSQFDAGWNKNCELPDGRNFTAVTLSNGHRYKVDATKDVVEKMIQEAIRAAFATEPEAE